MQTAMVLFGQIIRMSLWVVRQHNQKCLYMVCQMPAFNIRHVIKIVTWRILAVLHPFFCLWLFSSSDCCNRHRHSHCWMRNVQRSSADLDWMSHSPYSPPPLGKNNNRKQMFNLSSWHKYYPTQSNSILTFIHYFKRAGNINAYSVDHAPQNPLSKHKAMS